MIKISYEYAPKALEKMNDAKWFDLRRIELDFYYFAGDVTLILNGTDLSDSTRYITIFDFIAQLNWVSNDIEKKKEMKICQTESDFEFYFQLDGDELKISNNYDDRIANANLEDLKLATKKVTKFFIEDVKKRWPDLMKNVAFQEEIAKWDIGD